MKEKCAVYAQRPSAIAKGNTDTNTGNQYENCLHTGGGRVMLWPKSTAMSGGRRQATFTHSCCKTIKSGKVWGPPGRGKENQGMGGGQIRDFGESRVYSLSVLVIHAVICSSAIVATSSLGRLVSGSLVIVLCRRTLIVARLGVS